MKFRPLTSYILLSILVILLLCTEVQANEYREVNAKVKAEDILKHIENDDDINLTDCSIVGELNVSKIKLKTIPNPYFHKSLDARYTTALLFYIDLKENLSIIESNITIENSTFKNTFDFSNVLFINSADFSGTIFNNSADFTGATFNNSTNFSWTIFNNSTNFSGATFYNLVYFAGVIFNNSADFTWATFHNSAYFIAVEFNDSAYFFETTFNNSAGFSVPETLDTSKNIFTDGQNCEMFSKNYNNLGLYSDADTIYYNYRKYSQEHKSLTSFSKWIDILSWATCGYGVRPLHALRFVGFLILLFSIIYLKGQGITKEAKKSENESQEVPFLDALYFSIATFTGKGYVNWYPKEDFRKWVMLEGLLGWIILAIFTATLLNVMLRV
ncbi:MAG: pentapeptide repeat-containing protein [Methanosarcina sp.]